MARVISRSSGASELFALDNPTSQIRLSAQVVGAAAPGVGILAVMGVGKATSPGPAATADQATHTISDWAATSLTVSIAD